MEINNSLIVLASAIDDNKLREVNLENFSLRLDVALK